MRNSNKNSISNDERLRAIETFFWVMFPFKGELKPETTKCLLKEMATNLLSTYYEEKQINDLFTSIDLCCDLYYENQRKIVPNLQELVISLWLHGAKYKQIKEIYTINPREYIGSYGVDNGCPKLLPVLPNGIHERLHDFNEFVSHYLYKMFQDGFRFGLIYDPFLNPLD